MIDTPLGRTGSLMMVRLIAIFMVLFSCYGMPAYADTIEVSVDREPVRLNESFQIIFTASGRPDEMPDLSPLQAFFEIFNQRQSSRYVSNIINGRLSQQETWVLSVTAIAKHEGTFSVPAIHFGRDKSRPFTIEVGPAQQSSAAQTDQQPIFIEAETSTDSPYVQAEVRYTVRLFYAAEMVLSNGELTKPQLATSSAHIERIGEDRNYQVERDRYRYNVIERQYVIYPQESGPLKIPSTLFRGRLGKQGSFFGLFDLSQSPILVRRSSEITLQVRPIPDTFPGGYWLPASRLQLSEQWSDDPLALRQGEGVTRTITLEAQGLPVNQLPEVVMEIDPSLRVYPDQAVLDEHANAGSLRATRIQKTAIVPSQAGSFVSDAMRIPWWNTDTDELEYASLPALTITVLPAVPVTQPDSAPSTPQASPSDGDVPLSTAQWQVTETAWKQAFFISLSLWFALILYYLWRQRVARKAVKTDGMVQGQREDIKQIIGSLHRACIKNQPDGAKQALLDWASQYWSDAPSPTSLHFISRRVDAGLARSIIALNQRLYSGHGQQGEWSGMELWECFHLFIQAGEKQPGQSPSTLEPLHRI